MIRVEALPGVIDADPGSGLVRVGGRHRARRPQRGAGRARAGDGEPRRHRPPDDRRGDLDRHPRHRRAAAQHLRPGRGPGAGPRRRQRPPAHRRDPPGAAAGGPGRGRGPGRDRGRDPALRPRLHARAASTRRARASRCSTPSRSCADANDHFELFTFPYADSALVLERNRTEAPPRPRGRAAAYLNDVVLENWALEALSATGKALPRRRSRRSRGWPAGSPPAAARSTAATASSPTTAASASPRWSTACRASTGRRRRGG